MKRILNSFSALLLSAAIIAGCNNAGEKESTSAAPVVPGTSDSIVADHMATDNQAMNKPGENVTPVDSTATVANTTAVMPNPAKKGKKGMVSITPGDKMTAEGSEAMDKEGYYTNVYPAYPGGDKALGSFFEKNIQYPADASDNGVEGTVTLSFTVDENGKIGNAKTISPKIGYGLEDEALRVFKKMPSWKPGSLKGKNVKTRYNLPVRFQLES